MHTDEEALSWFTEVKTNSTLDRELVPLARVARWKRESGVIARDDRKHFSVMGVRVKASSREVSEWAQPMLAPVGRGVIAFLGRYIGDAFHVLVHARTEAGTRDLAEMAPTVNCIPDSYSGEPAERHPRYLDVVLDAPRHRILIDILHSEEGGRFYHAVNRYLVIDVGEEFGLDVPPDYCWMTPEQLTGFVRFSNHVNVSARCLLSCMVSEQAPFLFRGMLAGNRP